MKKISLVIMALYLFICTGCDVKDLAPFVGGTYNGFIINKTDTSREQTFVTAQLNSTDTLHYSISISPQNSDSWTVALEIKSKKEISISIPSYFRNSLELFSIKNSCFESRDPINWARLCYSHAEVTLDYKGKVNTFTLVLDPGKNANTPTPEPPKAYTKNELLNIAINQSFASRIEFERVTQSQLKAKVDAGRLFPSVSMNTLIAFLSVSVGSILKDIGDLAPFFLPNRWFQEQQSKLAFEAEFNGWITIKADAANIVEGLALEVLETEQTLQKLEENEKFITGIRDQIRNKENSVIYQIGTSDDVTSIINDLDQSIERLKENVSNGYAALAQAAGFINPNAISNLILTTEDTSIDTPTPFDPDQMTQIALKRAYELRQIDLLLRAAQKEKNGSKFDFLDPNGNPSGSVGLGYPSYIKIGESKEREIFLVGQKIQSFISEKLKVTFNEISEAEIARAQAIEGQNIANRSIARYQLDLDTGIKFELASLVAALQERVKNDIILIDSSYRYLLAWSKINRLLYSGPYSDLSRGDMLIPTFNAEINSVGDHSK